MSGRSWGACLDCGAALEDLEAPCPQCGSAGQLALTLDAEPLEAGQDATGRLRLRPGRAGGVREAAVALRWGAFGPQDSTDHRAAAAAQTLSAALEGAAELPFSLWVPFATTSHTGPLLRVTWALGARVELPDGTVRTTTRPVEVRPGPTPTGASTRAAELVQGWARDRRDDRVMLSLRNLGGGLVFGLVGLFGLLGAGALLLGALRGGGLELGALLLSLGMAAVGLPILALLVVLPLLHRARQQGVILERAPESAAAGTWVGAWARAAGGRRLRWRVLYRELCTTRKTVMVRGGQQEQLTHQVHEHTVAEGELGPGGGELGAELPAAGPSSLYTEHRKLEWFIEVGHGRGWTEVRRRHPLYVLPWRAAP